MKGNLLVLFIFFYSALLSQWLGSFEGSLNGDIVKVNITSQSNSKIVGEMFDSQQKFNIKGDLKGNKMTGEAVEQSLGLKFTLLGELKGDNSINFNLIINILGLKSETPFTVTQLPNLHPTPHLNLHQMQLQAIEMHVW